MRVLSVLARFAHLLVIFGAVSCRVLSDAGCPVAESIVPCTCDAGNALECVHVDDAEILRTVFQNSLGYTYSQVNISFSSLQYLPHDMFEKTPIVNLILHNVTLVQLFDSTPRGTDIVESLRIQNTQVSSRFSWDLLENFTQLKILAVYFNSITTLDTTFSHYVSKNLERLTFYGTGTRRIKADVLVDFVNLNKVTMDSCQLTTLSRNTFPSPFNVQDLHFNDNRITSIPEDLFTDMPNLQTLSLRNNLISFVPESAFDGNIGRIGHVWLEGNPLKCDCQLRWIIRNKPEDLRGHCAAPKRLHRKELKDLSDADFTCSN